VIDVLESPGGTRGTSFPSSRFFGGSKTARIHIDANGNLTNDGNGKVYTYDAANRMTSITQASSVTGFVYDGLGHRVQETLNGALIKQWVWCGGAQPCEERSPSGDVTKRFYAQGEQINGTPFSFTYDHLGSVREMTDSTGAIRARYDYDPYGRQTKLSGDLDADFGFCGYYNDTASGGWATMNRILQSDLARWTQPDPIGERGGINLYGYVDNNPINWIDQFGLEPGHPYPTPDVAAYHAEKEINPKSIAENREYAGVIYQNSDNTYSYTAPNPGTETGSHNLLPNQSLPPNTFPIGDYHTHGDYSSTSCPHTDKAHDAFNSDNFSDIDIAKYDRAYAINQEANEPYYGYLGTPSGSFQRYTPNGTPGVGTVKVFPVNTARP
jgi:RHS repeat-associated protein